MQTVGILNIHNFSVYVTVNKNLFIVQIPDKVNAKWSHMMFLLEVSIFMLKLIRNINCATKIVN